MGRYYSGFAPYVPVAQRRAQAQKKVAKLQKSGKAIQPISIEGRKIARTFWGTAWNDNLESYRDFENRLPRGRTYVRNGSVVHLQIEKCRVEALVSGSSIYEVKIEINPIIQSTWDKIIQNCTGKIDSIIELLQGKFSKSVMQIITEPTNGLFPSPKEIKMSCSCPDYAVVCKHVAAVLYGVGSRLDDKPEALFLLRGADHHELLKKTDVTALSTPEVDDGTFSGDLSALFGIDIEGESLTSPQPSKPAKEPDPVHSKKRGRPSKIISVNQNALPKQSTTKKTPVVVSEVPKKRGRPRKNLSVVEGLNPSFKKTKPVKRKT